MSRGIVSRRGRRGFTLLQLLGVIGVVTALSAVAFPAFVGADGPTPSRPSPTGEQEGVARGTAEWERTVGFPRYEQRRAARLHRVRGGAR